MKGEQISSNSDLSTEGIFDDPIEMVNESQDLSPDGVFDDKPSGSVEIAGESIADSYEVKQEDIDNLDFDVKSIQKGEHTALFSNEDGRVAISSDYLDAKDKTSADTKQALAKNLNLAQELYSLALDVSLVDASRGGVLDGSDKSDKFGESLTKVLEYRDDEASPEEVDAINDYLNQLGGKAFSMLLFYSESRKDQKRKDSIIEEQQKEKEEQDNQKEIAKTVEALQGELHAIQRLDGMATDIKSSINRHFEELSETLNARRIDTDVARGIVKKISDLIDDSMTTARKMGQHNEEMGRTLTIGKDRIDEDTKRRYDHSFNQNEERVKEINKETFNYAEKLQQAKKIINSIDFPR